MKTDDRISRDSKVTNSEVTNSERFFGECRLQGDERRHYRYLQLFLKVSEFIINMRNACSTATSGPTD